MKVILNPNGTYSARLRNGYVGTESLDPKKAKANAVQEFNKDLKMVNQKASDFGVRITYIDATPEEMTWTPGS